MVAAGEAAAHRRLEHREQVDGERVGEGDRDEGRGLMAAYRPHLAAPRALAELSPSPSWVGQEPTASRARRTRRSTRAERRRDDGAEARRVLDVGESAATAGRRRTSGSRSRARTGRRGCASSSAARIPAPRCRTRPSRRRRRRRRRSWRRRRVLDQHGLAEVEVRRRTTLKTVKNTNMSTRLRNKVVTSSIIRHDLLRNLALTSASPAAKSPRPTSEKMAGAAHLDAGPVVLDEAVPPSSTRRRSPARGTGTIPQRRRRATAAGPTTSAGYGSESRVTRDSPPRSPSTRAAPSARRGSRG